MSCARALSLGRPDPAALQCEARVHLQLPVPGHREHRGMFGVRPHRRTQRCRRAALVLTTEIGEPSPSYFRKALVGAQETRAMHEAAHKAIADIEAGRQVVCTMEDIMPPSAWRSSAMPWPRLPREPGGRGPGHRRDHAPGYGPGGRPVARARIAHVGNGCWCGWGDGMRPASWDGATTGVRVGSRPHRHREGGR